MKILVIENIIEHSSTINRLILHPNIEVVNFSSTVEAETYLNQFHIDLIIVDAGLIEIKFLEYLNNRAKAKNNFSPYLLLIVDKISEYDFYKSKLNDYVVDYLYQPVKEEEIKNKVELFLKIISFQTKKLEKLQEKNKELTQTENKLRNILENYPDGMIIIVDKQYRLIFAEGTAINLLGFEKDKIIGRTINEVFSEGLTNILITYLSGVWKDHQVEFEFELQKNSFHCVASPLKNVNGTVNQIFIAVQNITDFKNAQNKIKESEEIFRVFMDFLPAGVFIKDEESRYLFNNKYNKDHFGVENWEGKTAYDFFNEDLANQFIEEDQKILKGETLKSSVRMIDLYGEELYLDTHYFPISKPDGKKLVGGISLDVTKEKLAQQALESERVILNSIVDRLPVMLTRYDPNTKVLGLNKEAERLLGWTSKEVKEINLMEEVYPDPKYRGEVAEYMLKASNEWREFKCRAKSGEIIESEWSNLKLQDGTQIGIGIDVRERKQRETSLSNYKILLERIINSLDQALILIDSKNRTIIWVNNAFEKIFGYSQNEIMGKTTEFLHVDLKHYKKFAEVGNPQLEKTGIFSIEYKMKRKDGSIIFTENYVSLIKDEKGNWKNAISVIRDITDKKEAELALRMSEEKYRLLVENQTDLVVKVDPEYRYQFVSKSYCKLFGKTEKQLLGKKFLPYVHKEDIESTKKEMEKLSRPPYKAYMEQRAKTTKGWRWLAWSDKAIINNKGKIEAIIGVGRDITERKNIEIQLRESEEAYRTLINSTADAIYVLKNKKLLLVNKAWLKMFGYSEKEVFSKDFSVAKIVAPSTKKLFKERYANPVTTLNKISTYEMQGITKHGKIIDIQVNVSNIIWRGERVYQGIYHDITERKEYERKIIEERNRAERYFETASIIMLILNNDGNIVAINSAGIKITGYTKKYLIGKNFIECFIPETEKKTVIKLLSNLRKKVIESTGFIQLPIRGKNKKDRIIGWYFNVLKNNKGVVTEILMSGDDITEEIRIKNELEKSNLELARLTNYLQEISEEERAALARAIHDDLGQALTALKLDLNIAKNSIKSNINTSEQRINSALSLATETIKTVQQITSDLRPGLIDDLGLIPAIEWYTNLFMERTKIKVKLHTSISEEKISNALKITIYRIIQEALTNVVRHAKANLINIKMKEKNTNLELTIQDNGKGISQSAIANPSSFGILGMKERVKLANGLFVIDKVIPKGTKIEIYIPLK